MAVFVDHRHELACGVVAHAVAAEGEVLQCGVLAEGFRHLDQAFVTPRAELVETDVERFDALVEGEEVHDARTLRDGPARSTAATCF